MNKELMIDTLRDLGACADARNWLREAAAASPQEAWDACERPDWMMWLVGVLLTRARKEGDPAADALRRDMVRASVAATRLVLHFVPEDEKRPLAAVELAERWLAGQEVSIRDASDAADEAEYAAERDLGDGANAATWAAAYTAWTVAEDATYYGDDAVSEVVGALYYGNALTDRAEARRLVADAIRTAMPHPPTIA